MSQVLRASGSVIDRYDLISLLGRGGMGEVWLAHDERLERDVAIKLLLPAAAAEPAWCHRFEHEARVAARLSHPNVVAVFDCGDDDGEPFIVMERLPGRTVADVVRDGPVPLDRVTRWADQLLGAVAAAHRAGVLHRDIKPSNLLLTESDDLKVADFGIAKAAEGSAATTTGLVLGTAAYLAPERLAGKPASPASDQYAAAVVLYELLTGVAPFSGDHPLALVQAIHDGQAPSVLERRPDAPAALAAAVTRAMAPDPATRFPGVEAMHAAITTQPTALAPTFALDVTSTLAATETLAAAAPIVREPSWFAPRSRGIWIAVMAVLLLAGAVVLSTRGDGAGLSTPPTTPATTVPVTTSPPTTTTTVAPATEPPATKPGKGKGHDGG